MTNAEPYELTATELLEAFSKGAFSPVDAVESCLERIARIDSTIGAVMTVMDAAAREASVDAAKRWRAGTQRPLEGVPIGLKDIIDAAGVPTTAGSRAGAVGVAKSDATLTRRLRSAGAIPIAKLQTFEFAYGSDSPLGHTRNPWDVTRSPGGSSSGSAAALAARELPLAIGTDTGGSIRIPAAFCGVSGLKPTYGLVPRTGIRTLSWSLDHAGPMARSAEDLALALKVMAGDDGVDPASFGLFDRSKLETVSGDVHDLRIGIPDDWFFEVCDAEVSSHVMQALTDIEAQGARLIHVSLPMAHLSDQRGIGWMIAAPEAAAYHSGQPWDLSDYGQEFRNLLLRGHDITAVEYLQAQRARSIIQRDLQRALSQVDVIASPASVAPAPPLDGMVVRIAEQDYSWTDVIGRSTHIFNLTGAPAVAVPAGFTKAGLPISIQFASAPFADHLCIQTAYALQQCTDHHKMTPPLMTPPAAAA